ncbi:30S ribosomal protein S13 [bacterium]|jgi:small subunit ribosomal protein S13|nr:30S ribosomal protein S13 [bacterium]MBT3903968.1 30S ribosomal protein S13 [bacterium]MBT4577792.1 30S ribosomal protein S13 [bacterium]MBT5346091.1 30S ribosomal protein S13 [bacterium]MBT6131360.1 30S ribosomal protein S13 [bacterium]
MARISGVTLRRDKRVEYGLTGVKGIGVNTSRIILGKAKVDLDKRVKDLGDDEIATIQKIIDLEFPVVEGELNKRVHEAIKRLRDIHSYRGLRHHQGLPVRGQNTKNNARTRKGPRRQAIKKK